MLKSRALLIFSFFALNAMAAEPVALSTKVAEKVAERVPVEIEWEKVAGAKVYDLEFQNMDGKILNTFKSPSALFKFKMNVGKYKIRSRAADARKVYGDWSAVTEFVVQPKPAVVNEKSATTKGKIDPHTLTSDVIYQWGDAPGAAQFRLKITNAQGDTVKEITVTGTSAKVSLGEGEYTATLVSLGAHGIESDPVVLPGKITIETVQLAAPEIILKDGQLESLQDGTPVLKVKQSSVPGIAGFLEYRFFFGDEWIHVDDFTAPKVTDVALEKAKKPGRYRITVWSQREGLKKSKSVVYEFVVKPKSYE